MTQNKKKKINRENIALHLMEYQLGLIGKTTEEALQTPDYLKDWTLTQEQFDSFYKYSIQILKKVFKCNTNKAKNTFDWFISGWGLKVKQQ